MHQFVRNEVDREIEKKDSTGEVVESQKVKAVQYLYPCRPQVLERKKKWVKFGEAKDVPKGTNKQGVVSIVGPVVFLNDEGQVDQ